MAKDVDTFSNGRLVLGVGAGWQEREHRNFGFDLLDISERFERFEEGLEVITRLLRSDEPVDFEGEFYELHDATLLPRPERPGGPPILVGGNGRKRTLPLAAKFADEWNGVYVTPDQYATLSAHLDNLLSEEGREPEEIHRSLMTGCRFGKDDATLQASLGGRDADELRARGLVVGTPNAVVEQLQRLSEAGVETIMLQWLDLDDLDGLEALAGFVLPQL
jgi:alkanesulfonate monooxygenase SsuD/methylene tetrahydromethanopterin reductase-like flavin-dependent oxidoreductase (luciferase family)